MTDPTPNVQDQQSKPQQQTQGVVTPTVGRIVVYVDPSGREYAAVVTSVQDAKGGLIGIHVFEEQYINVNPAPTDPKQAGGPYWKWPAKV